MRTSYDFFDILYTDPLQNLRKTLDDLFTCHGIDQVGGSDFHGYATRFPQSLGLFTIEDEWAEKFYRPEN